MELLILFDSSGYSFESISSLAPTVALEDVRVSFQVGLPSTSSFPMDPPSARSFQESSVARIMMMRGTDGATGPDDVVSSVLVGWDRG